MPGGTGASPLGRLAGKRAHPSRLQAYCANKAVYYLNTDKSVQAMIPRSRTPYSLNYMNLTLELRQPLFQLDNLSLRA